MSNIIAALIIGASIMIAGFMIAFPDDIRMAMAEYEEATATTTTNSKGPSRRADRDCIKRQFEAAVAKGVPLAEAATEAQDICWKETGGQ